MEHWAKMGWSYLWKHQFVCSNLDNEQVHIGDSFDVVYTNFSLCHVFLWLLISSKGMSDRNDIFKKTKLLSVKITCPNAGKCGPE